MPRFEGKPARLSPRRAIFWGTHIVIIARLTPSVSRSIGKYGCANAKASFCLREISIIIIYCAFQNRYFGLAHSICRIPATSAGEVARFCNMRALELSRNEGRALQSQKIAGNSLPRFTRVKSLARSKTTLLDKRTQFVAYLRPGRVKPRDFVLCVRLKHRAARAEPSKSRLFVSSARNKK